MIRYGFKQMILDSSLEKRFDKLEAKIENIETNHFGHLKNYLGILNGVFLDRQIIDNETEELVVKVYNINEGRNTKKTNRCEELRGYAYFVSRVRYHEDAERKLDPALDNAAVARITIRKAIQDCKVHCYFTE